MARTLARLVRFPSAGEVVDVQLLITPRGDGEKWLRTFAGRPLVSLQSEGSDGLLVERMGLVEMRFRLTVVEGALLYQTTRTAIRLGQFHIPLPHWFSPCARASEKPVNAKDQIAVCVEVCLPVLGCLIAYEGKLSCIGA